MIVKIKKLNENAVILKFKHEMVPKIDDTERGADGGLVRDDKNFAE